MNLRWVTSFPSTSCTWVSYLKDHDEFRALGFGLSLIAWKITTSFSSHMSHLFSNATFPPKCLILYQVAHGKQYCLHIIGPPIFGKLPMFSFHKASSYTWFLLVIYSCFDLDTKICSQFNLVLKRILTQNIFSTSKPITKFL